MRASKGEIQEKERNRHSPRKRNTDKGQKVLENERIEGRREMKVWVEKLPKSRKRRIVLAMERVLKGAKGKKGGGLTSYRGRLFSFGD